MRERRAGLIGLAIALGSPAAAAAQSTPPPDVPVAACPAGSAPAALRVARDAEGAWTLGSFAVRLSADGLRVSGRALTLRGRLGGGLRYSVRLAPASARRLALTVRVSGGDAVVLSGDSAPGEAVHGFGAQTRWDLKHHTVPVLTREQGVGRGDP